MDNGSLSAAKPLKRPVGKASNYVLTKTVSMHIRLVLIRCHGKRFSSTSIRRLPKNPHASKTVRKSRTKVKRGYKAEREHRIRPPWSMPRYIMTNLDGQRCSTTVRDYELRIERFRSGYPTCRWQFESEIRRLSSFEGD